MIDKEQVIRDGQAAEILLRDLEEIFLECDQDVLTAIKQLPKLNDTKALSEAKMLLAGLDMARAKLKDKIRKAQVAQQKVVDVPRVAEIGDK